MERQPLEQGEATAERLTRDERQMLLAKLRIIRGAEANVGKSRNFAELDPNGLTDESLFLFRKVDSLYGRLGLPGGELASVKEVLSALSLYPPSKLVVLKDEILSLKREAQGVEEKENEQNQKLIRALNNTLAVLLGSLELEELRQGTRDK